MMVGRRERRSLSEVSQEEEKWFEGVIVWAGRLVLVLQTKLPPLLQVQPPHLPDQRPAVVGHQTQTGSGDKAEPQQLLAAHSALAEIEHQPAELDAGSLLAGEEALALQGRGLDEGDEGVGPKADIVVHHEHWVVWGMGTWEQD